MKRKNGVMDWKVGKEKPIQTRTFRMELRLKKIRKLDKKRN